jgi:DNA-binding transcriptional ArsR family regulator
MGGALTYNHMVVDELDDARADLLFHALSDRTRRDIVKVVMGREFSVSELARRYPMSFAAVQKHVAVLERAGLVGKHQRGREQLVRGRVDTVRDVHTLLDQIEAMWRDRLDRFSTVLDEQEGTPT